MYDRLIACGYTEQMAADILKLFPDQGKSNPL